MTTTALSTFTVGVTGHRPNRLVIREERVRWRLAQVLAALRTGTRARVLSRVAISALAEGADRLFADAALELGYRLDALLPFASADYETTFGDATTTPDYRSLLARMTIVQALPNTLADSKAAYEAAGRTIVERCDVLVAVWDGKPAAGRGGTPEIIEHALACGKPTIWIDAARDRPPRLLRLPTAHGLRVVPLERLAGRARALTARRIVKLASKARAAAPGSGRSPGTPARPSG